MKFALISPLDIEHTRTSSGARIAQIEDQPFTVAAPYFWIACDETIDTIDYSYDLQINQIIFSPQKQQHVPIVTQHGLEKF
jgi:hypothetical protein